ncbi:hypothetical protein QX249_12245 [Vibrio parahaemolyticus]|uniref:Uncharacterized protein n=1 Tax=Vibrio parahaemolyticus TaxID=670 RepID=A0AAW8PYX7_VIBPH|nr:hypothetical protein [Vibrio parahaemolyticus]EGR2227386.1 hypothetical protein [Vibrio parahaemolyticus]MDS1821433.1 hypothetical protein [Vibrio parahaemolyticus]
MKSVKQLITLFTSLSLGMSVGCSVSGEGAKEVAKESAPIEYSTDTYVAEFGASIVNGIPDYEEDIFRNNGLVNIPVIVSGRKCFVIVDDSTPELHVEQMHCRRGDYF